MSDLVYQSINEFPLQVKQVISDFKNIKLNIKPDNIENIIVSGMGGSLFSFYIINSFFKNSLKKPVYFVNDYDNPAFLSDKTLFIASSYSGTTEEVITTTAEAIKKTKYITGITIGSTISELLKKGNFSYYHINPKYNPSGQPRLGFGYMIFGTIYLLKNTGLLNFDEIELTNAIDNVIKKQKELYDYAQSLITQIKDKIVIYSASEHLSGAVHVVRNQTNESSKHLAHYNLIPELNHHLMEGLQFPADKNIIFLFYNSPFYNKRNQFRIKLTSEIVDKNNVKNVILNIKSENRIEELISYLQFGAYLTYLLGVEHKIDPAKVPWVDYFKNQLSKI